MDDQLSTELAPSGADQTIIGLDIGGTKTDAVALDSRGEMVARVRLPTGYGAPAVIATALEAVAALSTRLGSSTRFVSVGIGIPGVVDSHRGRVEHAVNLGIDDLDLAGVLVDRLGLAVRVENDVNAAAVGVFHQLELPPQGSMAYLNLGTGLAAGLLLHGELWRGARGNAGEIGHIPVDRSGPLCPCGQHGCLELVASGSALLRRWPVEHKNPVGHLFASAAAKDEAAIEVRDSFLAAVASGVRTLALTFDVDRVVIGGGVTALGAPLLDGVRDVLIGWGQQSSFLASLDLPGRVSLVPPTAPDAPPAAALGAALLGRAPKA